jgi:hypothetical protein
MPLSRAMRSALRPSLRRKLLDPRRAIARPHGIGCPPQFTQQMYFLDDISVNSSGKIYIPYGYHGAIFERVSHRDTQGNIGKMGTFKSLDFIGDVNHVDAGHHLEQLAG